MVNKREIPRQETAKDFDKAIKDGPVEIEVIPNNTIVRFNGGNVHRGPMVKEAETRLLLRLINTDRILPRSGRLNPNIFLG
jgi:hypothetical protein